MQPLSFAIYQDTMHLLEKAICVNLVKGNIDEFFGLQASHSQIVEIVTHQIVSCQQTGCLAPGCKFNIKALKCFCLCPASDKFKPPRSVSGMVVDSKLSLKQKVLIAI
jgi:hypothetical protein